MQENYLKQIKECASILKNGGVVSIPTETVFGLAVVFDNEKAYQRLNVIKNRDNNKPYTLMIGSLEQISEYAYINEDDQKIIDAFMPGSITLLLRAKENVPSYVTHESGIIGIRIPSHPLTLELLKEVEKPLLVPSANKSGQQPAKTYEEVKTIFSNELDYIIECPPSNGLPSTIVDLTKKEPLIIREGPISLEDILSVLKKNIL